MQSSFAQLLFKVYDLKIFEHVPGVSFKTIRLRWIRNHFWCLSLKCQSPQAKTILTIKSCGHMKVRWSKFRQNTNP